MIDLAEKIEGDTCSTFFKGSRRGDLLFVQAFTFITGFMLGEIIACLVRNDFSGWRKRKPEENHQQHGSDGGQSNWRSKGYTWFTASVMMVVSLTVFVP